MMVEGSSSLLSILFIQTRRFLYSTNVDPEAPKYHPAPVVILLVVNACLIIGYGVLIGKVIALVNRSFLFLSNHSTVVQMGREGGGKVVLGDCNN